MTTLTNAININYREFTYSIVGTFDHDIAWTDAINCYKLLLCGPWLIHRNLLFVESNAREYKQDTTSEDRRKRRNEVSYHYRVAQRVSKWRLSAGRGALHKTRGRKKRLRKFSITLEAGIKLAFDDPA